MTDTEQQVPADAVIDRLAQQIAQMSVRIALLEARLGLQVQGDDEDHAA